MSWSLSILNGDLNIGGANGLNKVTGKNKLVQDLKCWILESVGTDPLHPNFGSTLDGGQLSDGTIVDGVIGQVISNGVMLNIEAEIIRILNLYRENQIRILDNEQSIYGGQISLTPDEILLSINGVDVSSFSTTVVVRVSITTAANSNIIFTQPVGAV